MPSRQEALDRILVRKWHRKRCGEAYPGQPRRKVQYGKGGAQVDLAQYGDSSDVAHTLGHDSQSLYQRSRLIKPLSMRTASRREAEMQPAAMERPNHVLHHLWDMGGRLKGPNMR